MIKGFIDDLGGGRRASLVMLFAGSTWFLAEIGVKEIKDWKTATDTRLHTLEISQALDNQARGEFEYHRDLQWHPGAGESIHAIDAEISNLKAKR